MSAAYLNKNRIRNKPRNEEYIHIWDPQHLLFGGGFK